MKALVLILVFGCLSVFAMDDGPISPRDYTCDELNQELEIEGVLYVKTFMARYEIYSREFVNEDRPCRYFGEYIVRNHVRTKDKYFCWAGYKCEYRRDPHNPYSPFDPF